jgi:hypothetical protein
MLALFVTSLIGFVFMFVSAAMSVDRPSNYYPWVPKLIIALFLTAVYSGVSLLT